MAVIESGPEAPHRLVQFACILRSEICKLFSVRSTYWMLLTVVVSNVVLAALAALFIPSHLSAQDLASTDRVRLSLAGLHISQIAFGVMGTLFITSEYGTGTIRATLAAIPQRRLVLAAKSVVFALTALIGGIASSLAAYYTFEAFLSEDTMRSSIGDAGVFRALFGGGLYLAVLGLLGLGLGAAIRSSAGTIATLFSVLFVPSILISLLPDSWQTTIGPYAPMEAGSQIFIAVQHDSSSLGAWPGFAVFCVYATTALVIGFVVINHRDA